MSKNKEYQMAIKIAGEIEKSFPAAMNLTKAELRALAKEASATSKTMRSQFRQGLNDTKGVFNGIEKAGKVAFKAVASAATVAAVATAAIGAASIKTGMDFESQMSAVKAISGASAKDFEKLQEKAKQMGADTVFSSTESGKAMEYMAQAGWKTKAIIGGIDGVMNLAAASGEDLASTSDIVTGAITAFNLKAKDTVHFSDVLATAANDSNTDVAMMGESFKYAASVAGALGYSTEDTALALGLMANSGIKASQAGTSLRKIFSETTNHVILTGKAYAKHGEKLGKYVIHTANANGSMKSWGTTMESLRKGFSGLSQSEKAANAEAIAGKTGMAGLLSIMNASDKDYNKLKKSINDCSGAAKEMSKTRLDNLSGDVELFKSELENVGINIYSEIKEPLRDVTQGATKWISGFSKEFKTEFPTVIRTAKEAGSAFMKFADPVITVGEWLLDNPDVLVGTVAGLGTALITYKVASGVMSLADSLTALAGSTAGIAILGAGATITAIAGIGTAMEVSSQQAADANLAEHFGNVSLSMEELDDAARQIIGNKYLNQVDALMGSMDKADGFVDSMSNAMDTIQKTDWKVSVGLKLSKNDVSDYKSSCQSYVKNAQDYIDQQGYTVSVATKLLLGDAGKGITNKNNAWYAGLQQETDGLSKELNKQLDKAVKSGLTIDTQAQIDKILGQINKITQAVADAQNQAKLDVINAKYDGVDLTADSFKNLQGDLKKYVSEATKGAEDAYYQAMASQNGQLKSGKISQKQYDKNKKTYQSAMYDSKSNAILNSYNAMMQMVEKRYGKELDPAIASAKKSISTKMAQTNPSKMDSSAYLDEIYSSVMDKFLNSSISPSTKKAVVSLMDGISPSINELKSIQKQSKTTGAGIGKKTNQSINSAVSKTNSVEAITGKKGDFGVITDNYEGIYQMIGEGANSAASKKALADATKANLLHGTALATALINGMNLKKEEIGSTAEKVKKIITDKFSGKISMPVDFQLKYDLVGNYASNNALGNSTKPKTPKKHAAGGIFSAMHLGMVAEAGPEAVIPLNSSEHAYSLWLQVGKILGIKNSANSFSNLSKSFAQKTSSNGGSAGNQIKVNFSPVLQFNSGTPNKKEVKQAVSESYTEFEKNIARYIKKNGRVSFS